MKKREFMDELETALSGNVSAKTYNETMMYYEDYFNKEKQGGLSENEICAKLGSARLIAKTIIETENQKNGNRHYENDNSYYYDSENNDSYNDQDHTKKGWHININENGKPSVAFGKLDFSTTLGKIVLVIIAVFALAVVIALALGVVYFGMYVIIYIVLPVLVILFLYKLIKYLLYGE